MEKNFCQSCSMPLDAPELLGTEHDGSKSAEFCKFCYENGEFTNPDMTLDEMRECIIEQMEKECIPTDIIETAVNRLQHLKRWKSKSFEV
ncbi:zinc ribbon domain-containing protein [Solitalea lacus]|uniref:zinc ribbon domain-containing protein n=1 Tax=Solitalea lacus TaxID=2911172 RepID=UPI001ED9F220|nr:zinc ribbon domain-containing protein [Solitalea lacus]UKJ06714.1 zinc ribbon domain-containing protein [Solitalea lacus]